MLVASIFLTGCGVSNPLCSSARPVPVLSSLTPDTATVAQVLLGVPLTVNGSHFYSESYLLWNGASLPTTVISSTELQATVTTTQMPSAGSAQVVVHTPANFSGDLGCNSGGDSKALTFTVSD